MTNETSWVNIEGEEYEVDEALYLLDQEAIERCFDEECPFYYHKRPGYSDGDLLVLLGRRPK